MNFKTFDGSTLDAPFPAGQIKFEVVQELEEDTPNPTDAPIIMEDVDAPIVIEEFSLLPYKQWD